MTQYIVDLNPATPDSTDLIADGDNELRNLKQILRNSFSKVAGEVSASSSDLNKLAAFVGNVVTDAEDTITGTHHFQNTVNLNGDISVSGAAVFKGTAQFGADVTVSATLVSLSWIKGQNAGFGATVSFSASPRVPTPTDNNHVTSKGYVDAAVVGGGDPTTVDIREYKNARLKLFFYGQN